VRQNDVEKHEQWVGLAYIEAHGLPGYPAPDLLRKNRCSFGRKVVPLRRKNNDAAQRLVIAGTASHHRNLSKRPEMAAVIVALRPACVQPQEGA